MCSPFTFPNSLATRPFSNPILVPGTHLRPEEFHAAMANPNSIMIDVRNFNESLIGKFAPPPPAEGVEKVRCTANIYSY